jgi:alpha-D-ribose 1-methylphosphonate 5-triphosphate diphosphatase
LRGSDNARAILAAIEAMKPQLSADTRYHLRHETFNLAAEDEICDWVEARRVGAVAFNDHLPAADSHMKRPDKFNQMVERSGIPREDFVALVDRLNGMRDEVPDSIERIAAKAGEHKIALLSHDDASPEQRRWFRSLGCRVSEFPVNIETAREAAQSGDPVVLGAPNVMRGKSHMGWVNASEMVSLGLCSVLASDYYYPAPLIAAFRLFEQGVAPLEAAWRLVSGAPAAAVGLDDRGQIAPDKRADLILVSYEPPQRPRVVAVIAAGRVVHLTEPGRLSH